MSDWIRINERFVYFTMLPIETTGLPLSCTRSAYYSSTNLDWPPPTQHNSESDDHLRYYGPVKLQATVVQLLPYYYDYLVSYMNYYFLIR